jgi:hypothetical protein
MVDWEVQEGLRQIKTIKTQAAAAVAVADRAPVPLRGQIKVVAAVVAATETPSHIRRLQAESAAAGQPLARVALPE